MPLLAVACVQFNSAGCYPLAVCKGFNETMTFDKSLTPLPSTRTLPTQHLLLVALQRRELDFAEQQRSKIVSGRTKSPDIKFKSKRQAHEFISCESRSIRSYLFFLFDLILYGHIKSFYYFILLLKLKGVNNRFRNAMRYTRDLSCFLLLK